MRKGSPVPPYRAGTNFKDPTRSGFARVPVLNQEDLFPNEGYTFPETRPKPPTNSYRISEDSPFSVKFEHSSAWREPVSNAISQSMNTMLKTEEICNRVAVGAISAPTPGELRPLHSEIANRAVQRERAVQLKINEQIRLQTMKVDDYWTRLERDQVGQTQDVNEAAVARHRAAQRALATSYQTDIVLHSEKENALAKADIEEAKRLDLRNRFTDETEARTVTNRHALALQTKKEGFEARTAVAIRKQREIEDSLAEEERIAVAAADLSYQRDQRALREKQLRDEKAVRSEKLIAAGAKAMQAAQARQVQQPEIAPSEYLERTEARRKAKDEERQEASRQRNRDYNQSVRLRDQRPTDRVDTPDFTNSDEDALKEADARMKLLNMNRLRSCQRRQADERRGQEEGETISRLAESRDRDTMYFLKDNAW
jgi:hypothetical protein